MTPWQKDVGERRRIRVAVEDLMQRAAALDDSSEGELRKALEHVKSRTLVLARNANSDLGLAACQCSDPDLRKRIEETMRELDELVF